MLHLPRSSPKVYSEQLWKALVHSSGVSIDIATDLENYMLCKDLNTLPLAGGLFDQDALWVWKAKRITEVLIEKANKEEAERNRKVK